MLYCVADAGYPMRYITCGNVIYEPGFVHPRRSGIDCFVLIVVVKGTLHIRQGNSNYDISENEFILLLKETLHYGYKPSSEAISYYWVHFYMGDPLYSICSRTALLRKHNSFRKFDYHNDKQHSQTENVIIAEYGKLSFTKRSQLLFVQLLDIAKQEKYNATWQCHYALSMLLLEVTYESYHSGIITKSDIPIKILDIMEWIRTHYDEPLTVAYIAKRFNYHPTYLTGLFKKHTNSSLISYLNRTRITAAKNLLTSSYSPLILIARACGYQDEKYFMKIFKKYEGMTPTQYRKSFHEKTLN